MEPTRSSGARSAVERGAESLRLRVVGPEGRAGHGGAEAPGGYRSSLPWRVFDTVATGLDRRVGWDRLPLPLALGVLVGLRNELRRHNLHDSNRLPSGAQPSAGPPPSAPWVRTADGSHNDPDDPRAGMAGTRFGRNVPLDSVDPDPERSLLDPNPREVSLRVLTRREFVPATTVNVLVSAWLQFMIHDWFSHGHGDAEHAVQVPISADDDWAQDPMVVPRTMRDPTRPADDHDGRPTFVNTLTHWWDLSSVYGTSDEEAAARRAGEGGRLRVGADGLVPLPEGPGHDPTRVPGFWVGLAMLVNLFTLEHNAICERLARGHPDWDDEELYQRARLVNAAVVAKLHTVEWTPAVISHPVTKFAMRANWFGLLGEKVRRRVGRFGGGELLSGIPGSRTQSFGVPFSLTEEFAAVYRMHPLLPDHYRLKSAATGQVVEECEFGALAGPASRRVLTEHSQPDLFYSLGTEYAGAIVLRNFPRALQNFARPNDGKLMDLGAVDLVRTREAGVPRYNEMRRLLRMRPVRSFSGLTDDASLAADLTDLYDGDVEKLDLMIGMFAEKRPTGFAFSDTAFRIFILMASRRLNSDRFFASDYDPRVYSTEGMRWIEDATMTGVLHRHYPGLATVLDTGANAFEPWTAP